MHRITLLLPLLAFAMLPACSSENGAPLNTEWQEISGLEDRGWLLSVWGTSRTNRYAVGGELETGIVARFDGEEWQDQELPSGVPLLNWVHGFSAKNATVVGNGGTILHFDGKAWKRQASSTEEDLWGVWGAKADDLWAVGGSGRPGATATLLHFDGDEWTPQELPEFERTGVHALYKVWGSGARDIYAVGQRGIVLRFDGEKWKEQQTGASDDLIAVWGTGPDNVLAVGGRGGAILSHYDGDEWRTERLFDLPGVNGVWMRSAGVAHLAAAGGNLVKLEVDKFEYEVAELDPKRDFHGVFGIDGQLTAVGGNFDTLGASGFKSIAFERNFDSNE